jgi:hypothetical protein
MMDSERFTYCPGKATAIVVWPVAVIADIPCDDPRVAELYAVLADDATLESVLNVFARSGVSIMPSFGAAQVADSEVRLLLRGDATAAQADGNRLSSTGVFLQTSIPSGTAIKVSLGDDEEPKASPALTVANAVVQASRLALGSDVAEMELPTPAIRSLDATQIAVPTTSLAEVSAQIPPLTPPSSPLPPPQPLSATHAEPDYLSFPPPVVPPVTPPAAPPTPVPPVTPPAAPPTPVPLRPAVPAAVSAVVPPPVPVAPGVGKAPAAPSGRMFIDSFDPDQLASPSSSSVPSAAPPSVSPPPAATPTAPAVSPVKPVMVAPAIPVAPPTPVASNLPSSANSGDVERTRKRSELLASLGSLSSAPVVTAVSCPSGHLNPPFADRCRICGAAILTQQPVQVSRPQLGVLRLSSGGTVPLDRGAILGRSPQPIPGTIGPEPNLVKIADPDRDVSAQHLEVRLSEWFVEVVDLGSTNGTVVILPGRPPEQLRANEPKIIELGTRVELANVVSFVYEVNP